MDALKAAQIAKAEAEASLAEAQMSMQLLRVLSLGAGESIGGD